MNENILYVIEIINNDEPFYVFNKRILLHNPEIAKKFKSSKLAYNYYKSSEYYKSNNSGRIVKYDKLTNRIYY